MLDARARAYAILGLPAGASAQDVRKRYRLLASRWHPDRFAGDAAGQAEAAVQMRVINDAVRLIAVEKTEPATGDAAEPAPSSRSRLSRAQVEGMIASIGTDGPIDWFFGIRRRWEGVTVSRSRMSAMIAWGLTILVHLVYEMGSGGRDASGWMLVVLFVAAFALSMLLLPKEWVR